MTISDALRPSSRASAILFDASLAVGFSFLIGLSAAVSIPLPFTPVPVTTQTLAVLLAGGFLGSRKGALVVLLCIAEGALGLPFFSGGAAGVAHLLGPTGGFLAGFVASAFIAGLFSERGWNRRLPLLTGGLLLSAVAVYIPGLVWLGMFVGYPHAIRLGLLPFIVGDLVKIGIAASLLSMTNRIVGERAR
jgi:biotin transport system substrate-specific component